ncbi:hypothetical protein [Tateyamaria sp.]|uniref:hypothetical protein n=1 Tax=Tateyamaria sp. TaxID=1929288 RepID=UPI00329D4019
MSEIWIPCDCGDPDCPGYRLDDLGRHPFFVPFDRSKYEDEGHQPAPDKGERIPFGVLATDSWNFDGERTDLNDLFAVLWGAYLRCAGIASVSFLSERGFIESEVSSRMVIPWDWGQHYENWDVEQQKLLLAKTSVHMHHFVRDAFYVGSLDGVLQARDEFEPPPWLAKIAQIFSLGEKDTYELQMRQKPQWTCLTNIETGLTVAEISYQSAETLKTLLGAKQLEIHLSDRAMALKDNQLRNAVDLNIVEQLHTALSVLDGKDSSDAMIIPMASHVLGIGYRSLVSIATECGQSAFNKELQRVAENSKREDAFFMTNVECVWADEVPDDRFEAMIGELVKAERGVLRARQIGSTREADDGRDFIAEWVKPHVSGVLDPQIEITEATLSQVVDVLVQVKIRTKGVGRGDITGIRDTIEHHDCEGMLFVAFPNVTTTLNDHLNKLRKQNRWWIDWWNKADIEDRLRRNTSIAERYPDIVQLSDV